MLGVGTWFEIYHCVNTSSLINRCLQWFLSAVIIALGLTSIATAAGKVITGHVIGLDGQPVIGASVSVFSGEQFVAGQASDLEGRFRFRLQTADYKHLSLRVSSIGYKSSELEIERTVDSCYNRVSLESRSIELKSVVVSPRQRISISRIKINRRDIEKGSRYSLIPTNPISSIKQPQVIRIGSSHSSKIRINGTSPRYYLNGIEIGQDPNHYGMFSIIPGSVVDEIRLYPHGASARFGLPSVMELNSSRPFGKNIGGSIDLSFVEATGSIWYGNDKFYVLSSLRKSVLDKLVKHLNLDSERPTVPPTNFQDIFVSAGWKISKRFRLLIDNYDIRDYLAYRIDPSVSNQTGIETYQHATQRYLGLQLIGSIGKMLLKIRGAYRNTTEDYSAFPLGQKDDNSLYVNLQAGREILLGGIESSLFLGKTELTLGHQFEYTSRRETELEQNNWNFLPPDVSSDNPFLYQQELNRFYGQYSKQDSELDGSGYFIFKRESKRFDLESGVRLEYFNSLAVRWELLYRGQVSMRVGESSQLRLFIGTFAENPAGRILEPYQVLIHSRLSQLVPIRSDLVSLNFSSGPVTAGIFRKNSVGQPVVVPDFNHLAKNNEIDQCFIAVRSVGESTFLGGNISFEQNGLFSDRLDIYGYYGYSDGGKAKGGITVPSELSVTHSLYTRVEYKLGRVVSFGTEATFRSGFPFTPSYQSALITGEDRFTKDFYDAVSIQENSRNFPYFFSINIRSEIDMGRTDLFISVSNITNHDNPIINTSDGFVYDAGILPSVGLKYTF